MSTIFLAKLLFGWHTPPATQPGAQPGTLPGAQPGTLPAVWLDEPPPAETAIPAARPGAPRATPALPSSKQPYYRTAYNYTRAPRNAREIRDREHQVAIRCFAHAEDEESFKWAKKVTERRSKNDGTFGSVLWGSNWDSSFLPIALMNENHFAVEIVKEVFGATIDDFGKRGSGGAEGLELARTTGMLETVLNNYSPTAEVRAIVYVQLMVSEYSYGSPERDAKREKHARLLAEGVPPEEFAAHTRGFRPIWAFCKNPERLERAIELFKPTHEALFQMHQRITLNPLCGRWSSLFGDYNGPEAKVVQLLEKMLPPDMLANGPPAIIEKEARPHASQALWYGIFDIVHYRYDETPSRRQRCAEGLLAATGVVIPPGLGEMKTTQFVAAVEQIAEKILSLVDFTVVQQILTAARADVLERSR